MSTYVEAIRAALHDALAADPTVFLYGQDIAGSFGGAFKATKGLAELFPGRVLNSPISEDAMAAVAIGAALAGSRPVIEFQFSDFSSIAFNQISNQAGACFWRTGHSVPAVFRLPTGGTPGGGPFHSQMPETWITSHPGLVVVAPGTVADAYGMLRAAIAAPDPVVFCEHKYLYNSLKDDFDPQVPVAPLGRALVRRDGADCTVVSYGWMLHQALAAADTLAGEGLAVEVVDLRCLRPLDLDTVAESLARTHRLVVASEAFPFGGPAAELVAAVSERTFIQLDAPPRRLCAMDTPIPYHPYLFRSHHPDATAIADAVRAVCAF